MSITAPLQPEVPSGDASRAVLVGLVDGLTGLAVADARRFVAEARMLVDLRVAAEAVDASMGWPVWVAEAALAQGVSEGSLRYRAERATTPGPAGGTTVLTGAAPSTCPTVAPQHTARPLTQPAPRRPRHRHASSPPVRQASKSRTSSSPTGTL